MTKKTRSNGSKRPFKTAWLQIRCTEEEKAFLLKKADEEGITLSDLILSSWRKLMIKKLGPLQY